MDPNNDNGKILRFNLDGSIPADNPSPYSHVYSIGHRNSQGMCLGPNGLVYFSEHGQYNFDEFNILEVNGNYGWPNVEGMCDGVCDWCDNWAEVSYCQSNNVIEPLRTWSPCAAVNDVIYYDHPSIPEWQGSVLMAVLGGFQDPIGGRLNVMHMSEDGLTLLSDEYVFDEFNQRVRDVAINLTQGAVYLAFNGPSYGGNGPNVIKEFRPASVDGVQPWQDNRGLDLFPNPATSLVTFEVSDDLAECQLPDRRPGRQMMTEEPCNLAPNWMSRHGRLGATCSSHFAEWKAHVTRARGAMRPCQFWGLVGVVVLQMGHPSALHAQTKADSAMVMLREAAVAAYSPLLSPEQIAATLWSPDSLLVDGFGSADLAPALNALARSVDGNTRRRWKPSVECSGICTALPLCRSQHHVVCSWLPAD